MSQAKCLAWWSSACGLDVRAEVLPTLSPACCLAYPKSGWELSPLPVCSPGVGVWEQMKSYCTALVGGPCLSLEEHLLFSDSLLRWAWLCLPERGKLRHTEMK